MEEIRKGLAFEFYRADPRREIRSPFVPSDYLGRAILVGPDVEELTPVSDTWPAYELRGAILVPVDRPPWMEDPAAWDGPTDSGNFGWTTDLRWPRPAPIPVFDAFRMKNIRGNL